MLNERNNVPASFARESNMAVVSFPGSSGEHLKTRMNPPVRAWLHTRGKKLLEKRASIMLWRSIIHLLSASFIVIAFGWMVAGKNCEKLDGKWYNQLGSEVFLKHGSDGRLWGEYRTAAERFNGSAGASHSVVLGYAPYDYPGASFAFSVVWRNGTSTTVWTGQCIVCHDGHEKILTSWLLRSKVDTCIDKWKSTRIGRDTFTRYEQRGGPRKPSDSMTEAPPTVVTIIKNYDPDGKNKPCSLNGNWYNHLGSEMILTQEDDSGLLEGEYRTAVERETGAAGTSHSKVLGIGQLGGPSSTFAFFVVWKNGASVTGWVGQCHICGDNKTETIESTWLLQSKIEKCSDSWKSTLYSEDSFTHTEKNPGPRRKDNTHVPDRSGDEANQPRACSGCQLLLNSFTLFSLSLNVFYSLVEY